MQIISIFSQVFYRLSAPTDQLDHLRKRSHLKIFLKVDIKACYQICYFCIQLLINIPWVSLESLIPDIVSPTGKHRVGSNLELSVISPFY